MESVAPLRSENALVDRDNTTFAVFTPFQDSTEFVIVDSVADEDFSCDTVPAFAKLHPWGD